MLNGYQPPTELCNLELPPLIGIDPIQHYRIISIHPIYGTLGNLQTLNSTMLQKAFLEMKDKRNLTLDNEARQKGANGSRFTYQAGNRHKRFITTLLSLAFDGFKTYISHKADKKLIKSMKIIRKNQKIMNKRITTVENDMLALAQATLHDLNELQNQLENTNARTDYLANRLINAETNLQKVAVVSSWWVFKTCSFFLCTTLQFKQSVKKLIEYKMEKDILIRGKWPNI